MAEVGIPEEIQGKTKPFLRWAGGKSWLIKQIDRFLPETFGDYHEPFLGGGSIFLHLKSVGLITGRAYLSDLNEDLINAYNIVKLHPRELIAELRTFENTEEFYYDVRHRKFRNDIRRAAQFIYLNKTSFNGIYRVNQNGVYNVPYGYRTTGQELLEEDLLALSKLFRNCFFCTRDFTASMRNIKPNDLVFLDPPYTVAHENNGFVKYNQKIFSWKDQIRLKKFIDRITTKGAYFILTNAAHDSIEDLYGGVGENEAVNRYSLIGGKGATRAKYNEYIYKNT